MTNNIPENQKKIISAAEEVLRLSRSTLFVNLRFMDAALSRLKLVPVEDGTLATDGNIFAFCPKYVLKQYVKERETCPREYLHVVMHCVFHHPFIDSQLDRSCWDLACDIAVENAINELDIPSVMNARSAAQATAAKKLKAKVKMLTAEKLYRHFLYKNESPQEMISLKALFEADDHFAWYIPPENQSGGDDGEDSDDGNSGNSSQQLRALGSSTAEEWSSISQRTNVGMETLSQQKGSGAVSMSHNLKEVTREKYDYTAFLKRFAVMGEAIKINDDEFDYIFYTYGLKLYEKMPLIEPLEYKEVKRIKEFVIAIDTSGSVSGELVQTFLQKTYNILKSTESFFTKINLHIIQCDAKIQETVKITSQEEFDHYISHMGIKGLGGTDFRPVFRYVDELVRNGEFIHLKGLIYFTDGYGDFPEKMPPYDTAFVFIDDEYNNPIIPPWAIKLVLTKNEI